MTNNNMIQLTAWLEHYWVKFTNVPYCYWFVKGLIHLVRSVGKPLAFAKETLAAAVLKEPLIKALIYMEMSVRSSKPTSIWTPMPAQVAENLACVMVEYQPYTVCCMCASTNHDVVNCIEVAKMNPPFEGTKKTDQSALFERLHGG